MSRIRTLITTLALSLATAPVVSADSKDAVTYRDHIRPLWENNCAACHGAASPYLGDFEEDKDRYVRELKGPRMDTYADLVFFVAWPDTGP